jgi:protein-disulfide isomerase
LAARAGMAIRRDWPTEHPVASVERMRELTSAAVPPVGPGDHLRGDGPEAIVYLDLACPACAVTWPKIAELRLRLVFRHFPVTSKHPRAPALHAAAEAAAAQHEPAFWELVHSIYRDQGRIDDPHLWQRAESFGLDLELFDRERRSEPVAERVRRDFESGIRAGVAGTPAAFVAGQPVGGDVVAELALAAASVRSTPLENESSEQDWPPTGRPERKGHR